MYVIIVYDVAEERLNRVRKFLKTRLNWVQNSAFEGELTDAQLYAVKLGLKERIDEEHDAILIYKLRSDKYLRREAIGCEKNLLTQVI